MAMTRFSSSLTLSLIAALGLSGGLLAAPPTTWKEVLHANEAEEFARGVAAINDIQRHHAEKQNDGKVMRGFHAKQHAALSGEFRVLEEIPAHARQGVFKEARSYPCYVRFSNGVGFPQRDRKPDVRGMGIKLVGVEGRKLLEGEEDAVTQDFLGTNNPINPARDGNQFVAFAKASLNTLTLLPKLAKELGAKEALRIVKFLATSTLPAVKSMASETFWSGAPIKIGPYAARFIVRPSEKLEERISRSADYLREDLAVRLSRGDLKWDFLLQFYVDDQKTPIEDTSIEWLEENAPPVKVAELILRQRDLGTEKARAEEAFANTLAYSPWHTIEEHRPLSHLMRIRRAVYRESAKLRHFTPEPDGTEQFE